MGEIINWLRGDKITIITLLQVERDSNLPQQFSQRPAITQWVLGQDTELIMSAVQQIVGTVAEAFVNDPNYKLEVNQNDDLRDKTPDCSLVVDISDEEIGVLFRVYLTGFIRSGSGWK